MFGMGPVLGPIHFSGPTPGPISFSKPRRKKHFLGSGRLVWPSASLTLTFSPKIAGLDSRRSRFCFPFFFSPASEADTLDPTNE
jgi:hypothetical protein